MKTMQIPKKILYLELRINISSRSHVGNSILMYFCVDFCKQDYRETAVLFAEHKNFIPIRDVFCLSIILHQHHC